VKRLPSEKPSCLIEAIKKPPIDVIRREPSLATQYADVLYTRGGRSDSEDSRDAAGATVETRREETRLAATMKSVFLFVQGAVTGMAILALTLLFQQDGGTPAMSPPDRAAGEAATRLERAVSPAILETAVEGKVPASSGPPNTQVFEADQRRRQSDQELRELQAMNHLLTAQVEDLRAKLVRAKTDLATMTSTKEYYVQKASEVDEALQEQKRQNWVAQRALGRALDKINP